MKTKLYAKDLGYEPIGAFKRNDPFALYYIYPRNERAYMLKGSSVIGNNTLVKLVQLGLKAVVWTLTYCKFGREGESRETTKLKGYGHVYGLPREYSAYIKPMNIQNRKRIVNAYGNSINRNHKYILVVIKLDNGQPSGAVVLVKSFQNQPRCWPRCLDQFIPADTAPMKNSVSVA